MKIKNKCCENNALQFLLISNQNLSEVPVLALSKQNYAIYIPPIPYSTFIWQQITSLLQRYYKNDSHLTNYGCHHWDTTNHG